jgi:hypothetical protein
LPSHGKGGFAPDSGRCEVLERRLKTVVRDGEKATAMLMRLAMLEPVIGTRECALSVSVERGRVTVCRTFMQTQAHGERGAVATPISNG